VKFLFISWTAYQPGTGTIGALENELHAFSTALAQEAHDVAVLTGTLPGEIEQSRHHLDGVEIIRIPELSPTGIPWRSKRRKVDLDQVQELERAFQPHIAPYLNKPGSGITTFMGMGEVDVQRAIALAGLARQDEREQLVNVPFTRHNDPRLFEIPFDLHVYRNDLERLRGMHQGAGGRPFHVAALAPDLMTFRRRAELPDEDVWCRELLQLEAGELWAQLPPLAEARADDHRRAIQALGQAQRWLGRPIMAVLPDTRRLANPDLATQRLDNLREVAEEQRIALRIFDSLEPTEMARLARQASLVVADPQTSTAAEGAAVETPTISTRSAGGGLRSIRSIATEVTAGMSTRPDVSRRRNVTLEQERRKLLDHHAPDRIARLVRKYEQMIAVEAPTQETQSHLHHKTTMGRLAGHPRRSKTLGHQLAENAKPQYPDAKIDRVVVSTIGPASRLDAAIEIAEAEGAQLVVMCSSNSNMDDFRRHLDLRGVENVLLVNAVDFEDVELNAAARGLQHHPVAAAYKTDISTKRNLTKVLFPGERVLLLDDDVTFPDDAQHARRAAKFVGPGAYHAVGIPVIEEGDHSTVHHSSALFGLDEPDSFVGAGCEVVYVDEMRMFPAIYGEDWMALLDSIGEGKLALLGDALQTPGWPLSDPQRAEDEAWGDFITNAAMEWMLREKQAGRLHKRSWTEMHADFLNEFRDNWIIGLGQLHAQGLEAADNNPRESYRFEKALESIDRQIAKIRQLDVDDVVDYVRKYADASDQFERDVSRLPATRSTEQRLRSLGIRHHVSSGRRVLRPRAGWAPARQFARTPPFLSDLWLETTKSNQLAQSLSEAITGDRMRAGSEQISAINHAVWEQRAWRGFVRRPETTASHPARSVVRWLATSPLIEQHIPRYMSTSHREKCENVIDALDVPDRQRALLRRALSTTTVLGLSVDLAKYRIEQLRHHGTQELSPEHFSDALPDLLFKPNKSIPALETSVAAGRSAFTELKQVFQEFFGARRNQNFGGAELNAIAFFRLAVTPVSDPVSARWQEAHRSEFLAGISGPNWQQLADLVNADDESGALGASLSEIWAQDWVAQSSAGQFRHDSWSSSESRAIASG
jgi:hypothetical protein